MITGLAHVCYTVSNLERALDFYCRQLGLTPAFEFVNEQGHRYGQYVHVGGRGFLELFEGERAPQAEGQAYRHLCLEVDDFEGTLETLRARGVEVSGVKVGKDHSDQAWIADPDGNRIELHHYTPESKQAGWLRPTGA